MSYRGQVQAFVPHEESLLLPGLHSIFVVSGDEFVRECVQRSLSAHGVSPVVFENAAGYLACKKTNAPACLILDVVLPDTCGFDLQRRLAGTCPPIIFVTRHAGIADSVRAMKERAFDFLTVPFASQSLWCSVCAALELDRVSRPQREQDMSQRERFARLTRRERQVMHLIAAGLTNKQVAWQLGITEITAQIHRSHVKQKMEVASLADLVRIAIRLGIVPADVSRPMLETGRSGVADLTTRRSAVA